MGMNNIKDGTKSDNEDIDVVEIIKITNKPSNPQTPPAKQIAHEVIQLSPDAKERSKTVANNEVININKSCGSAIEKVHIGVLNTTPEIDHHKNTSSIPKPA